MRILPASDRALLVEAADLDEAMRLNLAWDGVPGVVERVPGARTVLVRFDPVRVSAAELSAALESTRVDAEHVPHTREVTIPVRYDGEDLDEVASLLGVSAEEIGIGTWRRNGRSRSRVLRPVSDTPSAVTRCSTCRAARRRVPACRPARWLSPGISPGCTRARARAAGS